MKRALVTGGTRGIGLEVCRLLSRRGYFVTGLYSRDEAAAERARGELSFAEFIRADVSDEAQIREVFSEIPALDLLVNNAGIAQFSQVQDLSYCDWMRVMQVNAGGVFLCCKYATQKLLTRGKGAIVNLASVWGETGGSCESAYSASKGAVIAFTKALAKELAPSRITVNCVSPGVIDTDMNGALGGEALRALASEIPLGRLGRAEEVAQAVLFLAEQEYLTGQVLSVNGGFYI